MTLKVTVHDVEEDTTREFTLPAGEFVVLAVEPCHVADVQAYPTADTQVVTIKDCVLNRREKTDPDRPRAAERGVTEP
jgi:hypothetical protein